MFAFLFGVYNVFFGPAPAENLKNNLEITAQKMGFLSRYSQEKMKNDAASQKGEGNFDENSLTYMRENVQELNYIISALCEQAKDNFSLFQANWAMVIQYNQIFKLFQKPLVSHLLILAQKDPKTYNAFIKQAITRDLSDIELKKLCIKKAIAFRNTKLARWLCSLSNGWDISVPLENQFPILLYLAHNFEYEQLETLLSLQKKNGEFIVTVDNLNCEVLSLRGSKYTPLERVLGRNSFDTRIATLLRAHGATHFGSLDSNVKQRFLAWEQAQVTVPPKTAQHLIDTRKEESKRVSSDSDTDTNPDTGKGHDYCLVDLVGKKRSKT